MGTHLVSAGIAKREIDLRHKIVFVLVALPPSRQKLGCLLAYQSLGLGLCKNFGGCVKNAAAWKFDRTDLSADRN